MSEKEFDPNGIGLNNGCYFGLPFNIEESQLVLISAPWDVTASYGGGTAYGPDSIIGASTQLDLYDQGYLNQWKRGISTAPIDYRIQEMSNVLREDAKKVIKSLEVGKNPDADSIRRRVDRVNNGSDTLNINIYNSAKEWLDRGKLVGLVGGDHSTPYGLIQAVAEREGNVGVLHIDAHADLRVAYEGFNHSHASIMYNVSKIEGVTKIVQVALRDMCDAEVEYAQENSKITQFTDSTLYDNSALGVTWHQQCAKIIDELPAKVYISFDIDGLSPDNCPNTGTPVPGGLSFNQATYLLKQLHERGKQVVGFDLCEVNPSQHSEWDANVGARVLYKLSNLTLITN